MALKARRPTGRTEERIEKVNKVKAKLADDDSEYRKLKQFAFDQDESISDIVRKALREYMSKYARI